MKKIIPKTSNYELVVEDEQVQNIIRNLEQKDVRNVIDNLTRKYLRSKFKDKIIEGEEKANGVTIGVWYVYD